MYKVTTLAFALAFLGAQSASATAPAAQPVPAVQTAAAQCFGKMPANWQQLKDACTALIGAKDVPPNAKAAAYYNRGIAFQRLGPTATASAMADFTDALKLKPAFAHALAARGSMFIAQGKLDEGLTDLTKAIAADPKMSVAYNNRAVAYFGKRDFPKAIADFTKAVELQPNSADSYAARGSAYMSAHDDAHAMADLNKALALNPRHSVALYNRGLLYAASGQRDQAQADFKAVLTIVPGHVLAKKELARLAQAGG